MKENTNFKYTVVKCATKTFINRIKILFCKFKNISFYSQRGIF